jgi:hypothetical protein
VNVSANGGIALADDMILETKISKTTRMVAIIADTVLLLRGRVSHELTTTTR